MTPAQIDNCLAFLQRASLTGAEVGAYVEVVTGLRALRAAVTAPPGKPAKPEMPPASD